MEKEALWNTFPTLRRKHCMHLDEGREIPRETLGLHYQQNINETISKKKKKISVSLRG